MPPELIVGVLESCMFPVYISRVVCLRFSSLLTISRIGGIIPCLGLEVR